jgi:magnesium-transporting ATPase (P-type)
LIILAGTLGLFLWDLAQGVSIDYARTVAVNTLVMYEAFYLLNTRYITASVLSREGILGNRYVLLAIGLVLGFQLLFTYLGPMQHLFGTEALEAREWGRILLVGATVFVLVELEKAVLAWRVDRRRQERVGGIPA